MKSLKICSTLKNAKCENAKFVVALIAKHTDTSISDYRAEFLVGDFEDDIIIGRLSLATHNILLGYPQQFLNLSPGQLLVLKSLVGGNPAGSLADKVAKAQQTGKRKNRKCCCGGNCLTGGVDKTAACQETSKNGSSVQITSGRPSELLFDTVWKNSCVASTQTDDFPRQTVLFNVDEGEGNTSLAVADSKNERNLSWA